MKKQLFLLLLLSGLGVSRISAESTSEQFKNIAIQAKEKVEEKAEQIQEAAHDIKENLMGTTEKEKAEASEDDSLEFENLKAFLRKRTENCFLVNKMKEEPYAVAGLIATAPFLATKKYGKIAGAILGLSGLIGFSLDYFFNKDETPKKA